MMISTIQGLVACSDLTGYAKLSAKKSEPEIFQLLSDYYELVGDVIAPANGTVIKFMGDAALMLFPEDAADAGMRALLDLQTRGDAFLSERGVACRHHIRAHFGPMCVGLLGTRDDKRTDILGSTVNTMFMLKTTGFALTPEAFRKLMPETRRLFKKHTPPVVYIPTEQSHRD
jgi:class 3 adenylate cyclase